MCQNTGQLISALVIAPIAFAAGGFLSQHTETVLSMEEHPIYTTKGMELAWSKGFESDELTEIFCHAIFYYCMFAFINITTRSPGAPGFWTVLLCMVFSVCSSTFTETTLVEETQHDWNEHIQHSVVFFLIFWLVPILLMGCLGESQKTRID